MPIGWLSCFKVALKTDKDWPMPSKSCTQLLLISDTYKINFLLHPGQCHLGHWTDHLHHNTVHINVQYLNSIVPMITHVQFVIDGPCKIAELSQLCALSVNCFDKLSFFVELEQWGIIPIRYINIVIFVHSYSIRMWKLLTYDCHLYRTQ